MTDQARRATDSISHSDFSVEKLIAQEDSEKQRAYLLLQLSMSKAITENNKALSENTALTRLIAEQTKTHIAEHETMMAQSRVWVRVGRAVWAVLLFVAGWGYMIVTEWARDQGGRLGTLEMRVQKIEDVSRTVKIFEGRRP